MGRAGVAVLAEHPTARLRDSSYTFSGRLHIDEPPPGIENASHRTDTSFSR
jgi:hypothetical protein